MGPRVQLARGGFVYGCHCTIQTVTAEPRWWQRVWSLLHLKNKNASRWAVRVQRHSPVSTSKTMLSFQTERRRLRASVLVYSTNYWLPFMSSIPDWVMWFFKSVHYLVGNFLFIYIYTYNIYIYKYIFSKYYYPLACFKNKKIPLIYSNGRNSTSWLVMLVWRDSSQEGWRKKKKIGRNFLMYFQMLHAPIISFMEEDELEWTA